MCPIYWHYRLEVSSPCFDQGCTVRVATEQRACVAHLAVTDAEKLTEVDLWVADQSLRKRLLANSGAAAACLNQSGPVD